MRIVLSLLLLLVPATLPAQTDVEIRVDTGTTVGPSRPIWRYFGYDEPNYTYMKNGAKLVRELGQIGTMPVYIRAHNLLTTGDGTPALKWGSTNAYTEDATGKPTYDFTIVDRIFDTYLKAHAKPFVEIGFMPEALSSHPQPYKHTWPKGGIDTGWAYPPKDYDKWREVVYQWVKHTVAHYGRKEVESWYWEVWNEPDIMYWHGTPEEYNKLYDYAVDGVRKALPTARVGGPATTGPGSAKAAAFLNQFLQHCTDGANAATGKKGAPLDFITYHAKGKPQVVEGHVRMGLQNNLNDVAKGFAIVTKFPKFQKLPIILSESDPEGCAACSARGYPQNAYRNGALYPAYTAVAFDSILKLGDQTGANIEGMLTWAFEFEDQPYFDGFRTLSTNGVDKPILNFFRMAGKMKGDRVKVGSNGSLPIDQLVASGVRSKPDVDAFATRAAHDAYVLVWNYHDDDVPGPDAPVTLTVNGLPSSATRVSAEHQRIDQDHSNAYTVWKKLGSPQHPTEDQYKQLEAAGKLQDVEPQRKISARNGVAELKFSLPRQAVSLIHLSW